MDIDVECTDGFGSESYAKLFEDIMSDIGKAAHIEKARIKLDPHTPLFVCSVKLKAEREQDIGMWPTSGRGPDSHITITDERSPGYPEQL